MKLVSKSLHHSNIVFVFDENKFLFPENHDLTALYRGDDAKGSRFVDDPVLRTKILDLPKMKMQIIVEPGKLKIEDTSQEEPDKTLLVEEADKIYRQILAQNKMIGFGFNFDIYYQTDKVIRSSDLFTQIVGKEPIGNKQLLHLGFQFTLEKEGGNRRDTYFVKITAPMEVAIHVNYHFPIKPLLNPELPEVVETKGLFKACYQETDEMIKGLKF